MQDIKNEKKKVCFFVILILVILLISIFGVFSNYNVMDASHKIYNPIMVNVESGEITNVRTTEYQNVFVDLSNVGEYKIYIADRYSKNALKSQILYYESYRNEGLRHVTIENDLDKMIGIEEYSEDMMKLYKDHMIPDKVFVLNVYKK